MKHVLITGASGRIGSKLVGALACDNMRVSAMVQHSDPARLDNLHQAGAARVICAHCLDGAESLREYLHDVDDVIHLACTSTPALSQSDPVSDLKLNVAGTLSLFSVCQDMGVRRFVFASSGGTIYGNAKIIPTPESILPVPIGMHGAMKLTCENYLRAAAHDGDTSLQILRISNPYGMVCGPHQQGFIDVAISNLKAGRSINLWGDGTFVRDYLHISDLLAAFSAALRFDAPLLLNIGAGIGYSLNEVLAELGTHFDLSDMVKRHRGRPLDVNCSTLDITQAKKALGWRPRISLSEGIRRLACE